MPRGILLGAVAVGLATLTETRGQKAGTQVINTRQTGRELIAWKENPGQTLSDFGVNFHVVLPILLAPLTCPRLPLNMCA
jgi:hypothetical protein